jgi:hypothetical protein
MVTINLKKYYELYTILKKIERALDLYIGSFVSMTKNPSSNENVLSDACLFNDLAVGCRHQHVSSCHQLATHIKITVFKGRKAGAVIKQSLYFK